MRKTIHGKSLELTQGDITQQQVDAIVNAANSALAGGGGVDGAIHRAGGPSIMQETRQSHPGGCPTGSAVITGAGNLPAQYVIHAVGPIWRGHGDEDAKLLRGAYRASLDLARRHACQSVALPALSTGAYGYPMDEAARVALQTAIEFCKEDGPPEVVRFVLFGAGAYGAFSAALEELTQP